MAADRLTLALPVDIFLTQFDATVTQTQLGNNTVLGSTDDRDTLRSLIEDAEDEFRSRTSDEARLSRAGTPGDVETYEQQTFSVKGHEAFKRNWARTSRDYMPAEVELNLDHGRVLPFDSTEGDEVRVYRGMNATTADQWEDITSDEGDLWTILNHREGVLALHPVEIHRAMVGTTGAGVGLGSQRRAVRVALTYRFGSLGGGRGTAGETTLGSSGTVLQASDTDTPDALDVADAGRLPNTDIVVLIGEEYLLVTPDNSADTINVQERGVRGTNAAAHDSGDRVQYTPPTIRKAVAARAGMSLVQSGRYSAWLPDADDEITKDDMLAEMKETWNRTIEALS